MAETAIATVTVVAPPEVVPAAAAVNTGATVQFTTNVSNPTWSVQEGAAGGTVTQSGLYTAPSTAGTYHVVVSSGGTPVPPTPSAVPALSVSGGALVDPKGNKVILRGLSSQGMGMVYGDKANPGTYLPMTPTQYVNRAVAVDASGAKWESRALRLCFERFPCASPDRLYTVEGMPYAMPDTIPFQPWQAATDYSGRGVATAGGKRWRVIEKKWMADRGQPWNPQPYQVGDVVVTIESNVYRCTSSIGSGVPAGNWGAYPKGTGQAIPEDQGALQYVWQYAGPFGLSGSTSLEQLTPVTDQQKQWLVDNLATWQFVSADYTPAQAEANFQDWKAKVMDPAIAATVAAGMYAVVCDFDFGPAHHPLRAARMLDFWTRMASSQWANHPQVIFELWNESEDIGPYGGGPGSWAAQKPAIQATVDAVRAAGATNVIIVPPPFYSAWVGEATASPLTGTSLAYAWHQYRDQWEAYQSNRDQFTQAVSSGQAIIATEWGDGTNPPDAAHAWPTTTSVPPPLRGLFEPSEGATHPVAGWFAWALTQNWSPSLFSDNALTRPTPFGASVRQWLEDKKTDSQAQGGTP